MRAILFGGGLALLISLLGTRVAINYFTKWGYGQEIRDDGPTSHHTKMGTPTMGGLVIMLSALRAMKAAPCSAWPACRRGQCGSRLRASSSKALMASASAPDAGSVDRTRSQG